MLVTQLDTTGKKIKKIRLNESLFGIEPNEQLIAQYVHVHRKKRALGTKKTKGRGEVAGGGKKPWRQKGTGRARHGSTRSPIWVGGGHAHPLRPTGSKRIRMSKKMRIKALASALSQQMQDQAMCFLDKVSLKKPKTQKFLEILQNLSLDEKKVLVVTSDKNRVIEKSVANLPKVDVKEARLLNVYDVLNYQALLFIKDAHKVVEKTFVTNG